MNEMDKKMEEFFRRSMEQFDDGPSDNVWDQLSDQLESEETYFTKMVRSIRKVLPLAILFLSLGALSIYSYQSINGLKNTNGLLLSENLELQQSISTLNNDKLVLENSNGRFRIELASQITQTEQNALDFQKSKNVINNAFFRNTSFREKLRVSEALSISYKAQLDACANEQNSKIASINLGEEMLGQNKRGAEMFQLTPLVSWSGVGLSLMNEKSPNEKWMPIKSSDKELTEELLKNKTSNKKWQYRYGLTGRAYNTFVQDGINFNFSNSYGIKHELTFNERWSLTHSMEYNDQEYTVMTRQGELPKSVLARYPDSPADYASVRSVKSRSQYFDTQLGVKYQWPSKKGKSSYFVNPSVVWQLYLPQAFNFDLIQAQDLLVERRTYVGYLGSINLQLGLERSLTDKIDFQLALFAERSMIELGYDNQTLTLVGVRSSVLFGK